MVRIGGSETSVTTNNLCVTALKSEDHEGSEWGAAAAVFSFTVLMLMTVLEPRFKIWGS